MKNSELAKTSLLGIAYNGHLQPATSHLHRHRCAPLRITRLATPSLNFLTLTLALMFTARPSSRSSSPSALLCFCDFLAANAKTQTAEAQYARVLCILWLRFF